jgi:hypothetical protein
MIVAMKEPPTATWAMTASPGGPSSGLIHNTAPLSVVRGPEEGGAAVEVEADGAEGAGGVAAGDAVGEPPVELGAGHDSEEGRVGAAACTAMFGAVHERVPGHLYSSCTCVRSSTGSYVQPTCTSTIHMYT